LSWRWARATDGEAKGRLWRPGRRKTRRRASFRLEIASGRSTIL